MHSLKDRRIAFLVLLPSMVLLAIFVYGFIFATVQNSLTDWGETEVGGTAAMSADLTKSFVGLDNYYNLMTDPLEFDFRTSMVNTFFFTLLFVAGCLVMGFFLALLLDMRVQFEAVFRTIFLFPMAISLVVVGTIWRWLYQPQGLNSLPSRLLGLEPYNFNWINSREQLLTFNWNDVPMILTAVGLFILAIMAFNFFVKQRWRSMGWAGGIGGVFLFLYLVGFWQNTIWPELPLESQFIPTGFNIALTGIIVAAVWQMSGYTMAMFLAGIRGIPEELREAARVDGCSEMGVYWRVVLPQLRPVAISAMIILGHISLKAFDLVFAMSGKDNYQTIVPGVFVYGAFDNNRFAVASAVAVLMLLLVAVVVVPYLWTSLRREE